MKKRGAGRPLAVVGILFAFVLLMAACSGGDDSSPFGDDDSVGFGDESGSSGSDDSGGFLSDDPADSGDLPEPQVFAVNREVWHSGFRIAVSEGVFFAEERLTGDPLYYVTLDATIANEGTEEESLFFTQVSLVSEGLAAIRADDRIDFPRVPSGLMSAGVFAYLVEPDFDPASAQLVFGRNDQKQAVLPLGPDGGDLVALTPVDLAVAGSIEMALIDLTFTGASLRSDIPLKHDEVGPGELALTIDFDVTSRKLGNWNLFPADFALVGPDGNALVVDGTQLWNLPGSEAGALTPDHYVRFIVDDPAAGAYVLRYTPNQAFQGEDGITEATFEFVVS